MTSSGSGSIWLIAIVTAAFAVLALGLTIPPLGGWIALGTGTLAAAVTAALVVVVLVAPKTTGPEHCLPWQGSDQKFATLLGLVAVALGALSLASAIAAGVRKEHVARSVSVGLLGAGCGIVSFFVIVWVAVCGA